ncbi:MAG: GNAT family N-acetyltransferase [Pirellulaceae bacterium]|nr:GNAT family N-acetyltransferase [Pirellulaceae bacterium]
MIVQPLPWDEEFFGFTVGSLVVPPASSPDDVSDIVKSCDCDVVYVQVKNPKPDQLECFSSLAPLADHKIVYKKTISTDFVFPKEQLLPYEGGVTDALLEMAWASGMHSRYYLDCRFQPHYRRFYRTWLVNSIEGDFADVVFVPQIGDTQVGFVSLVTKGSVGRISLITVSQNYRKQGIGGQLLQSVDAWCWESGLNQVRVATQERNTDACRLYERHGYQVDETIGIYHCWKS